MTMTRKIGEHPAADEIEDVRHARSLPRGGRRSIGLDDEPGAGDADHPGGGARPRSSVEAVALNSWVWPSFLTRTLP